MKALSIAKTDRNVVTALQDADGPALKQASLSLAVAAGLVCAMPAVAQSAGSDIETIEVHGQTYNMRGIGDKLTGSMLDTPKSITIVDSNLMNERGATSLVDALKSVPGITFNAGEGGQPAGDNLKIRGFDAGADVFVDGVRDAGSQTRDVFALEQVEVLMGPGGAFAGRGSAGGSVNLATKRPKLEDSLSMRLGLGNEAFQRVAVDANTRFGDGAAARLNVLYHDGDVPGRDSVYYSHKGIAPSVAFGLDGDTQLALDYYYYDADDMPDYSIPYDGSQPAAVDRDNFYGLLNRDFQKTGVNIATAEISHRFNSDVSIANTTRYGKSRNDYVVTNPDDSHGNVENGFLWRGTKSRNAETVTRANQTNLRASLNLGGLEHSIATGFEIASEELTRTGYSVSSSFSGRGGVTDPTSCSFPGNAGAASGYECTTLANPDPNDPWVGTITPTSDPTIAKTDTLSAYFFDTVTLSERWLVNVGGRWDDYEATQSGVSRGSFVSVSNDSTLWNYQLGLVFKPVENGSVYLSTGTSSRPSGNAPDGTDALNTRTADLDPERNRTWELGVKWQLFDGMLGLQSAVFTNTKENARVATEAGRGAPQANIGEQRVKGFEIGLTGNITGKWSVMTNYTYLHSELSNDGPFGDSGNAFPNTPENSFNLWTTYAFADNLLVGAGANYVDKRFGNTANTVFIPDYTTVDLMANWQVNSKMSFQLNAQNLTDETYYTRPYAAHYAAIGPGRSVILNFTYSL